MFDTMVITKTVASLCGALLVLLLGLWAADGLYGSHTDAPQAYVIDTGEEDTSAEPVAELTFDEAFQVADAEAGARVWGQCRACHALEAGRNGVGPYLHGVVDRAIGSVDGFNYSGALAQVGDAWTPANLNVFIESPANAASGTSMNFRGIGDVQDRANLIAYIQSQS
jgi:cytochrome c